MKISRAYRPHQSIAAAARSMTGSAKYLPSSETPMERSSATPPAMVSARCQHVEKLSIAKARSALRALDGAEGVERAVRVHRVEDGGEGGALDVGAVALVGA